MKYLLGLLGFLLVSTGAWAAEQMTMYATLSAPIASFWAVETTNNEPISIEVQEDASVPELTMWATEKTENTTASETGMIKVTNKDEFYIDTLSMEKDTTFEVNGNNVWYVNSLTIGDQGTATFEGNLIAKTLQLPTNEISVSGKLFFGSNPVQVQSAQFSKVLVKAPEDASQQFDFDAGNKDLSGKTVSITEDDKKMIYVN